MIFVDILFSVSFQMKFRISFTFFCESLFLFLPLLIHFFLKHSFELDKSSVETDFSFEAVRILCFHNFLSIGRKEIIQNKKNIECEVCVSHRVSMLRMKQSNVDGLSCAPVQVGVEKVYGTETLHTM